VEYVPYTMVKYFSSSGSVFLPKTQTVRESDYFLNVQACSARGGLIHRPFLFKRVKHDNRKTISKGTPKLLPEHKIIEASQDGLLQIKKVTCQLYRSSMYVLSQCVQPYMFKFYGCAQKIFSVVATCSI